MPTRNFRVAELVKSSDFENQGTAEPHSRCGQSVASEIWCEVLPHLCNLDESHSIKRVHEITLPLGESPSQRRRGRSYQALRESWMGQKPSPCLRHDPPASERVLFVGVAFRIYKRGPDGLPNSFAAGIFASSSSSIDEPLFCHVAEVLSGRWIPQKTCRDHGEEPRRSDAIWGRYSNHRDPAGATATPPGRNNLPPFMNLGSNPNRSPKLSRLTS